MNNLSCNLWYIDLLDGFLGGISLGLAILFIALVIVAMVRNIKD